MSTGDHDRLRRLHDNEDALTGIIIALARGDYAGADTLLAGIGPAAMPDAIRQLCGLVVAMLRHAGHTDQQIEAQFREMAFRHALRDGGGT